MNGHDPYELLRRLNPIDRDRLTDADEARLEEILGSDPQRDDLARRRRARQLVAAAVLVAAVAGTAAWAFLRKEPATDPVAVECRATASLEGEGALVDASGDPVADCTPLWTNGTFGDGDVPVLTACVRDSGAAVVLPAGPEICEGLGLASLGKSSDEAATLRELQTRLLAAFYPVCVSKDDAIVIVHRTFDELGLGEWTVDVTGTFTNELPCAVHGVDPAARAVHLGGRRVIAAPMPTASVTP